MRLFVLLKQKIKTQNKVKNKRKIKRQKTQRKQKKINTLSPQGYFNTLIFCEKVARI